MYQQFPPENCYNNYMNPQYIWENFDHPLLKELKEKYFLEKVIFGGKNEFEKQILLKQWVYKTLPLGYNNTNYYKSALGVLNDKENAGGFNCTWYVLVFLQCASALGWYVRKLGIDSDHKFGEEEMRHTIVDVWSNEYKKWFVIDPMFNAHFEDDGKPLNALEIRKAYLNAEKIERVFGKNEKEKLPQRVKNRHDVPSNYFWFFILSRNNFLENPDIFDSKALLWIDRFNKHKTWFVGGTNKGEFQKHPMYKDAFIQTGDYSLCFPTIK